jgi:hypothetical protein
MITCLSIVWLCCGIIGMLIYHYYELKKMHSRGSSYIITIRDIFGLIFSIAGPLTLILVITLFTNICDKPVYVIKIQN